VRLDRRAAGLALTGIAGWVDAVGVLSFPGPIRVFPSFMGGNSTQAVAQLADDDLSHAALFAGVVTLFLVGVVLGRIMHAEGEEREALPLVFVAVVLGAALVSVIVEASVEVSVGTLALAMGAANSTLGGVGPFGAKTFVTSTIVDIGHRLGDVVRRRDTWSSLGPLLLVWGSLLAGGIGGALTATHASVAVGVAVPAAVVAALAVVVAAGRITEPRGAARR